MPGQSSRIHVGGSQAQKTKHAGFIRVDIKCKPDTLVIEKHLAGIGRIRGATEI